MPRSKIQNPRSRIPGGSPAAHPFSLERNRALFLGLFFVSNWLIAYSGLLPGFKIFLGLFGILLPLYVGLRTTSSPSPKDPAGVFPELGRIPLWLLAAGLVLAAGLRFYKLTTLFRWPTLDEGWNGLLALELSKHWTWRFFYTFGDAPPLPVWCAALLFKDGASAPLALWFPSALVSCATVALAFLAARQYFPLSFAVVLGGLFAFSYWPLLLGRFCHQGIWLPLWICGFLYLWGKFRNARKPGERKAWALASGVGLGLGSFTFTPWMAAAGFLFLWVVWDLAFRDRKDRPLLLPFGLGASLALAPFLTAVAREGFGHHLVSLSPWGDTFHEFHVLTGYLKYFAVLVWGAFEKDPAYTPVWGGFLDPILGAFFFLGIGEMVRHRKQGWVRWTAVFFPLFLLPGALSPNLEAFRVAQVLPLLLAVTAFGLMTALGEIPQSRRLPALGLLFGLVALLDFSQMARPYRDPEARPMDFGRPLKSVENYRAFRAFQGLGGLLLSHFDPGSLNDPTLSLMTQGLQDPPASAQRALVLMNVHYRPFLEGRFPGMRWKDLSGKALSEDGGRGLALFEGPQGGLPPGWILAHEAFRQADRLRYVRNSGRLDRPVSLLDAAVPILKGDPFLTSVLWMKQAAYAYANLDWDRTMDPGNVPKDFLAQREAFERVVREGYPTAEAYFDLGQMALVAGEKERAREAFVKATKAPLDRTFSKPMIEWLDGKKE